MKSLRVLVVEDDALIAMLLSEMLEDMGHSVCATESSEAGAVAAALRYKPDLMIVDVGLRDGSGVSAIAAISHTRPVPHLFVSGDRSIIAALKPDVVVVQKPFREADLARGIQRALNDPQNDPMRTIAVIDHGGKGD